MLTQKRLKEFLHYNPKTGIFFWKKANSNSIKVGDIAGNDSTKCVRIMICNKTYKAHRLAWLYMKGFMPTNIGIDHIDRRPSNNIWSNLRLASKQCNARNGKVRINSTTRITGVHFHKRKQNFEARIKINYKVIYLGNYKTKLEAARARWKAEVKFGYPTCNLTSSALEYIKQHS